jgi:hypothetical protein
MKIGSTKKPILIKGTEIASNIVGQKASNQSSKPGDFSTTSSLIRFPKQILNGFCKSPFGEI